MKKLIYTVFFLSSVISCGRMQSPGNICPGDDIPDFRVTMSDGRVMSSATLGRGVAVIAFFNTGCPDCRKELPVLEALHLMYPEVTVVPVAREESRESIQSFWNENALTMPFSAQEDRRVYELFASSLIPRVYVCLDGTVRYVHTDNPVASLETLSNEVEHLIEQ